MVSANHEQAEFWEDLAPSWLAAVDHTELVSRSFGVAAMDRLGLAAGDRVVDVGCGAGSTTIDLARRVGPEGSARGVDIAPTMVAAAQERAEAMGLVNVSFAVVDAQVEPLGSTDCDAIYSRFGLMFFNDPAAAFANIRASMRSGGVLAFSCWQEVFANEWMMVPGMAVVSVTGALPPMPEPGEPGPFSLSEPDRVDGLLSEAGFTDIEITPQADTVVLEGDEIESLVELSRRVGPVREALRTADAETAERVESAVRAALLDRVEDGVVRLSAGAHIVRAQA